MDGGMGGLYGGGDGGGYSYHHHQAAALEGGVLMSRDPKPRLRWTPDLHERFVDAVTKLGGPDITRSNYSYSRYSLRCSEASTSGNDSSPSPNNANYELGDVPISEALRCQLQIQNNLHQQLEVQQRLQTRIEAQAKYLQAILCKAQQGIISFDNSCKNSNNNSNQERILFTGLHVTDKEIKSVFDQIYPDDHAHPHPHPQGNRQDHDDNGALLKIKHEAAPADYCSLQLNLNNATNNPTPNSFDFGGVHGAELQPKLLACRR